MLLSALCYSNCYRGDQSIRIDRKKLVTRHFPEVDKPDKLSPFTVGNGEFAFTADFTGLQTFSDFYDDRSIPLGTQSHWGWHTIPDSEGYTLDMTYRSYDTYGRSVEYASDTRTAAAAWLRANPHRLHLGRIGMKITKVDGEKINLSDVTQIHQVLDLWEGTIKSEFEVENEPVLVKTACHPRYDQIAAQIESDLLQKRRLSIEFDFPYGSLSWGKTTADWNSADRHETSVIRETSNQVVLQRTLDADGYCVVIRWIGRAQFDRTGRHEFTLSPSTKHSFRFVCAFYPDQREDVIPEDAKKTLNASKKHWKDFWQNGGAVDLSESRDPRALELERRIVLSQYLLAVQCAGSLPPQETGLTCNSWFGKFHLEMHWWHAVQFALWGRSELFRKSLDWYNKVLPAAQKTAEDQGYDGVRWPKMVGPDGRESPSAVGVFLIWQQPHPIYYAELLYQIAQDRSLLDRFKNAVFKTADFMLSYAHWDSVNKRFVLGPPLIPAQEIYRPETTSNPAFELSYWAFGLKTAQIWRQRLGLDRLASWDHVLEFLSPLPQNDGLYQNAETALNTFDDAFNRNDHPTVLAAYGMLPNDSIDIEKMRRTLKRVMETWNWDRTWGWDYPLTAMTAARVGEPEIAIDALLMNVQKNTYLNNGHNYQDDRLTLYLPGNGGLLTAIAMMAAGWKGAPDIHAPGFPKNGEWVVRWEGLYPLL